MPPPLPNFSSRSPGQFTSAEKFKSYALVKKPWGPSLHPFCHHNIFPQLRPLCLLAIVQVRLQHGLVEWNNYKSFLRLTNVPSFTSKVWFVSFLYPWSVSQVPRKITKIILIIFLAFSHFFVRAEPAYKNRSELAHYKNHENMTLYIYITNILVQEQVVHYKKKHAVTENPYLTEIFAFEKAINSDRHFSYFGQFMAAFRVFFMSSRL